MPQDIKQDPIHVIDKNGAPSSVFEKLRTASDRAPTPTMNGYAKVPR